MPEISEQELAELRRYAKVGARTVLRELQAQFPDLLDDMDTPVAPVIQANGHSFPGETSVSRRKKTAEERAAISIRMKKYWRRKRRADKRTAAARV